MATSMSTTAAAPTDLVMSTDDPRALRERYERDGMVQVNAVLSTAEIEEIRDAFMSQVAADRAALGAIEEVAEDAVLSRYPSCSRTGVRTWRSAGSPAG